jgi:hypothetical protein
MWLIGKIITKHLSEEVKSFLVLMSFIDNWNNELEKMDDGKEGASYVYPHSFVQLLGYMRVYFHLPYTDRLKVLSRLMQQTKYRQFHIIVQLTGG